MSIFDDPRYHYTERFIREANPRGVSAPTAFERGHTGLSIYSRGQYLLGG